jgi:low affinity Fe/Cu permease
MPTATDGRKRRRISRALELLSHYAAHWSSSSAGFATALAIIVVWATLGPWLHYSDSWQLVINTGTTIVTFLMVFLIQRSQSKDALAIQLKLDEIVSALAGASNRLVSAEDLSEADLDALHRRYHALAERVRRLADERASVSVDAPAERGRRNGGARKSRPRSPGGTS